MNTVHELAARNGAKANPERIQPIDFSPVTDADLIPRRRINPMRWLIGIALLVGVAAVVFLLLAKSVYLKLSPAQAKLSFVDATAIPIADRFLMLEGEYRVQVVAPGYKSVEQNISIGSASSQNFEIFLEKLPGKLLLSTSPQTPAVVMLDGEEFGQLPTDFFSIQPGVHRLTIVSKRFFEVEQEISIEGGEIEQQLNIALQPAWAEVTVNTQPSGATVVVDGETVATTPAQVELIQGARELVLKLSGHKAWQAKFDVTAQQNIDLGSIKLVPADGLVWIESRPAKATILLNGDYQGQTPAQLSLSPGGQYRLQIVKAGYQEVKQNIAVRSGKEQQLSFVLEPNLGKVIISATPSDALLYVDGRLFGAAEQSIELPIAKHSIEIRKQGYVSNKQTIVPHLDYPQQLNVVLKTLEQAKIEAIQPLVKTHLGQALRLIQGGDLQMGASRREAGRRANEVLRKVKLTRWYYLAEKEVSNEDYRAFVSDHNSRAIEGYSLNDETQPVVQISWQEAALYCNWLSSQQSLPLYYQVRNQRVIGVNSEVIGYRLPTESEWVFAAKTKQDRKFPWGMKMPPIKGAGNFADYSATYLLGRVLRDYNDSYVVSGPVGSFKANQLGLYDMGGNVAEWTHDFYATNASISVATDPMGPVKGVHHVIKGSSWSHGTITELRYSFRDYGLEGRDDLGFRIARYVE